MSDYPMLISNKLHSFRNFHEQNYYIHSILMEKSFRVALLAVLLLLKVKNTVS